MTALENASQQPRIFYCRHMQPGVARYENEDVLVDTDGMKRLISSVGKKAIPVYVTHQDVDLKNIQEKADGYIADSFYGAADGWAWFKMVIVSDGAHDAIRKGWRVSNAYLPTEWGPGGTKNNVPYKREVRNGEFTHLAIVPDPRYEGAMIYTPEEFKSYQDDEQKKLELKNSNPKEKKPMFKFFKNEKKEVSAADADGDTMVELKNGKSVSMQALLDNYVAQHEAEPETVEVVINGKKKTVTLDELVNAMEMKDSKKKMKKNGESKMKEDPEEEDVDGDQDDEGDDEVGADKKNKKMKKNKKTKKNAEEEDCMNSDDEDCDGDKKEIEEKNKKEKKNATTETEVDDKYFEEMRNANMKRPSEMPMVKLAQDRTALAKKHYGSTDGKGRITH